MIISVSQLEFLELVEAAESGGINGFFAMPEDDYHALPFINFSSLKQIQVSPAHFHAAFYKKDELFKSDYNAAFQFGSAFHCRMLEPEKFESQYTVKPADIDLRTRAGQDWKKANAHRVTLSDKDFHVIEEMAASLEKLDTWKMYVDSKHYTELTALWVDRNTGLQCKARIDLYSEQFGILDLKTTSKEITDRNLFYAVRDYSYNIQSAHYSAGIRTIDQNLKDNFTLLFVEKNCPFSARSALFDETTTDKSLEIYNRLILDAAYAITTKSFPAPGAGEPLTIQLFGDSKK